MRLPSPRHSYPTGLVGAHNLVVTEESAGIRLPALPHYILGITGSPATPRDSEVCHEFLFLKASPDPRYRRFLGAPPPRPRRRGFQGRSPISEVRRWRRAAHEPLVSNTSERILVLRDRPRIHRVASVELPPPLLEPSFSRAEDIVPWQRNERPETGAKSHNLE